MTSSARSFSHFITLQMSLCCASGMLLKNLMCRVMLTTAFRSSSVRSAPTLCRSCMIFSGMNSSFWSKPSLLMALVKSFFVTVMSRTSWRQMMVQSRGARLRKAISPNESPSCRVLTHFPNFISRSS